MIRTSTNVRILSLSLLLVVGTALLVATNPKEGVLHRLHQTDLVQYWASAHLIAGGANPYDREKLFDLEREGSQGVLALTEPIVMWNPPTVLPLVFWLQFFDFKVAKQVWLGLSLLVFLCSVMLALRAMKIELSLRVVLPLVLFFPLYSTVELGQISWMLLLVVVGGVHFAKRAQPVRAGLALAVTFIKPHLLYLYLMGVLAQSRQSEALRVTLGILVGVVLLSVAAELFLPGVWGYWWHALSQPPHYFRTPTLGAVLQLFDPSQGWLRYVPMFAMSFLFIVAHRFTHGRGLLNDPVLLLPLSLVTAPYGWVFDQLLLIPLVLRIAAHPDWRFSAALLLAQSIAFTPLFTAQHHYVWYPLVLFALGAAAVRRSGEATARTKISIC